MRRLLRDRERLLRRLARLETERACGLACRHDAGGGPWSFHPRLRTSPRIVTTYAEALVHVLPDLAWSADDRARRRELLAAVHEAYADEDLARLRLLRARAEDRPPEGLPPGRLRRRLRLHLAWLEDRLGGLCAAEG